MTEIINENQKNFREKFQKRIEKRTQNQKKITPIVEKIIRDIKNHGDQALFKYTQKFDQNIITAENIRIDQKKIKNALQKAEPELVRALKIAYQRITKWHKKQYPKNISFTDDKNVKIQQRWTPIDVVGLYVPGGTAAYPSSVLMNAIPAKIAQCPKIIIATPAKEGKINPNILIAAHIADIDEIYQIGGAQAIAAFAYGTQTIPKVDKITGPGNAYVAEAKKQLFGHVGIDSIAGPSEVLIIADQYNNPEWIAADLLAQAEHDENAQAILITNSHNIAQGVTQEIKQQIKNLPRKNIAEKSWRNHGAIIYVNHIENAAKLANQIAPEHLQILVQKNQQTKLIKHIQNVGALFIGDYTPEALGDYIAGPNHVLPTNGNAKYASGLGVEDFMKRTTILTANKKATQFLAKHAALIAQAEGLHAHAKSLQKRYEK